VRVAIHSDYEEESINRALALLARAIDTFFQRCMSFGQLSGAPPKSQLGLASIAPDIAASLEAAARDRLPVIGVFPGFLRNQAPRSGVYEMDTAAGGAMHALVVAHAIARLSFAWSCPWTIKPVIGHRKRTDFAMPGQCRWVSMLDLR